MIDRFHLGGVRVAAPIHPMGCVLSLLGLLILLVVPVRLTHQFTDHVRIPDVRGSIERHIFEAQPEAGPAGRIADGAVVSTLLMPVNDEATVEPRLDFEPVSPVSLIRLLLRFKLGSARSGGQDPLL